MAMPAATPALIDRVEPNCAIDTVSAAPDRAASVSPADSCPNSSRQSAGQLRGLDRHRPRQVVHRDHGQPVGAAKAITDATSGWCSMCW